MKKNEMMDRPVINSEVRDYLKNAQKRTPGILGEIELDAHERRVPIIPHETVVYFDWLFDQIQPKDILEVGTAIGFSTALMAERMAEGGHVTTIDRNPQMIAEAKENIKKLKLEDKITILEGQASEILEELEGSFDFIFMDSAKAKYYEFFPDCMRLLKKNGVLAVDDVLQGGTILKDEKNIPKRVRKIHRMLNAFLDEVLTHPALKATILPLGDGLLLITKKEDADFSYMRVSSEE